MFCTIRFRSSNDVANALCLYNPEHYKCVTLGANDVTDLMGFFNGFLITRDGVWRLATRQRVSQRLFIVTTLLEREKDAAEK